MKLYHHDICGQYASCGDCYINMQTLTVRDDSETLLCCTWTRSSRCLQLYPDLLTTTPPSSTPECQDSDTHINSDCYWMRCHNGKWLRPEPAMTEHCCSTYTYLPERCAIGIYETEPIMTTTTSTSSPTTTTVTEPTTTLPTTTPCPCEMKLYHHDICGQYASCGDCYINMQTLTVRDDSETLLCCTWTRSSRCLQLYPDLLTTTSPSSTPECQDSDTHINSDCYWMRCHDGKWQRPEPAMTEHCCSTYTYLPERCAIGIYETEPIMTTTTSTPSPTTTTVTEPTTTPMCSGNGLLQRGYSHCWDLYCVSGSWATQPSLTLTCCEEFVMQNSPWSQDCYNTFPELYLPRCTSDEVNGCAYRKCSEGRLMDLVWAVISEYCCQPENRLDMAYSDGGCDVMFPPTTTEPSTTTTTTTTTTTYPTTSAMCSGNGLLQQGYSHCTDLYCVSGSWATQPSLTLECCEEFVMYSWHTDCYATFPELYHPRCTSDEVNGCTYRKCSGGRLTGLVLAVISEYCCQPENRLDWAYDDGGCDVMFPPTTTEPSTTTTTTTTTTTYPTTSAMCSGNGLLQQGYSHCTDLYCVSGSWATQPSLTLECCEEFVMYSWHTDCYATFPELYHPRCTSDEVNGCTYRKCSGGRLTGLVLAVISEYCCQPENRLDWAYDDGGCDEPSTTTTTTTTTTTYPTTSAMCSGNGLLQQGYSHCTDLYCVSGSWATQPSLTLECCEEFVMYSWHTDCYATFPELYHPRCTSDEVNGCAYRKCSGGRLMDLVLAVISEYCCQPENRLDWAYSDGGCDELYPPPCTTDEIGHHCTYRKCVGGRLMSLFYPVISEYCCRPENIAYQGFTNGYSDTTCEEMFPSTTTVVYATAVTSYPTPADFTRDPSSGQMYPCTENEIQAGGCYEKMCVNRYLSDVLVPIYNMDCCSNVLNSHDECYVSFPGLYTSTSTTAAATTTNEDVPEADALTG
ncbi:mucin-5AC-like [Haliotis cracherodii]|uniref:mucin-5AC-like n=1 Tax=Haliotis cracherodii TaxID=6455 RepID=UPI0039E78AAB